MQPIPNNALQGVDKELKNTSNVNDSDDELNSLFNSAISQSQDNLNNVQLKNSTILDLTKAPEEEGLKHCEAILSNESGELGKHDAFIGENDDAFMSGEATDLEAKQISVLEVPDAVAKGKKVFFGNANTRNFLLPVEYKQKVEENKKSGKATHISIAGKPPISLTDPNTKIHVLKPEKLQRIISLVQRFNDAAAARKAEEKRAEEQRAQEKKRSQELNEANAQNLQRIHKEEEEESRANEAQRAKALVLGLSTRVKRAVDPWQEQWLDKVAAQNKHNRKIRTQKIDEKHEQKEGTNLKTSLEKSTKSEEDLKADLLKSQNAKKQIKV